MSNKRILDIIGNIDEKFIEESEPIMKKKVIPLWKKITSLAACAAVIFAVGIGVFSNAPRDFTFEDGQKISFGKITTKVYELVANDDVETRELAAEETEKIFKDLDVHCVASFDTKTGEIMHLDVSRIDDSQNHVHFMNVAKNGYPLSDVVIESDNEKISEIDGVSVTAGYTFVGNRGILSDRVIYYAKFQMNGYTVMIENAGKISDGKTCRAELAENVRYLIKNADFDFSDIRP